MTKIDTITKKDIEAHQRVFGGLTFVNNKAARHAIAGMILADSREFDIGV